MKISTRFILIGAGLVLLIGLISNFPARLAYSWIAKDQIALANVSGTIWNGSAGQANISGVYLSNTKWRLSFFNLLTGKLAVSIQTSPLSGLLSAHVTINSAGNVAIRNIEGQFPISALSEVIPLVGVSGTIVPHLSDVEIENGRVKKVVGSITIVNLVSNTVVPEVLGTFLVELQTSESAITGSVEDVEAIIDIAGAVTLTNQGTYSFIGQIAEKSNTPARLRQNLARMGEVNERGQRDFRLEGSL